MRFPALYLTACYRDTDVKHPTPCRSVQCSRYPKCLHERCQAIHQLYLEFKSKGIDYEMLCRQQGYDPAPPKETK